MRHGTRRSDGTGDGGSGARVRSGQTGVGSGASADSNNVLGDMPHIRYAIDHLTREEDDEDEHDAQQENPARPPPPRPESTISEQNPPVERIVWDDDLGHFTRQTSPPRATPNPNSPDAEPYVAKDPPEHNDVHPCLGYVPVVLRPWMLIPLIVCCLLMIAGVAFCNVHSRRFQGLWDFDRESGPRYFVWEFLPQILGAILVLWTFVLQAAVYRIMPFTIMVSERRLDRVLQDIPLLSRNFLLPDTAHFRYGEPLVGFSLLTIWLANWFTIPLLSSLFQIKWYAIDGVGTWRWTAVQEVGWTLVSLYGLLTIGLLVLLVRFAWALTGVMWDPISLADLIPLIQRSNILHDFELAETIPAVSESLDPRALRVGYWTLPRSPNDYFYGIGEPGVPAQTPSMHHGRKKAPQSTMSDIERQHESNSLLSGPAVRYRWTPWFLRDLAVVAWAIIVGGLFIAFVVVSFVHRAIANGFQPRLSTYPAASGFSPSNFLYSFIPSFIGMVFFLAWQPVDVYFRALQPYASLSSRGSNSGTRNITGATAKTSLLLSYPSHLPFQTTIQALLNKHFKLAVVSFNALVSLALPIIGGGVFTALTYTYPSSQIRIKSLLPAFYALVAFCGFYTLSLLAVWPRKSRYLPHDISSVADNISFLYQSPLLRDRWVREPRSKADLVMRLVAAPPGSRSGSGPLDEDAQGQQSHEQGQERYGFGVYIGRDGREHLGIDRVRRWGRGDMIIV